MFCDGGFIEFISSLVLLGFSEEASAPADGEGFECSYRFLTVFVCDVDCGLVF